jgi:hypothetical protein
MLVKNFKERSDGGADIEIDLTPDEHVAMLQLGISTAIQLGIEELGDQSPDGETK